MLTYHAEIVPSAELVASGLYLNDPHRVFDARVIVYSREHNHFVGLTSRDILVAEAHDDAMGYARPVKFLDIICPIEDLRPYFTFDDITEGNNELLGKVSLNNWKLFNFLDEYEQACEDGAFDGLL